MTPRAIDAAMVVATVRATGERRMVSSVLDARALGAAFVAASFSRALSRSIASA